MILSSFVACALYLFVILSVSPCFTTEIFQVCDFASMPTGGVSSPTKLYWFVLSEDNVTWFRYRNHWIEMIETFPYRKTLISDFRL